jgi:prepilin peptidase CpaA
MTLWDHGVPVVQWGVVVAAALIGAWTDLSTRRLPNWLTFPLLAGGFIFAGTQAGVAGLLDSVAACVLVSLPFVLLFIFAQGGAGDAKMMGAIAAWLGLINGLVALAAVAVAGIILAVGYAAARGRGSEVVSNVRGMAQGLLLAGATRGKLSGTLAVDPASPARLRMPYGLAIFAGVFIAAIGVLLWRM